MAKGVSIERTGAPAAPLAALRPRTGAAVLPAQPRVVLDTNVVLDWLVFRDAGVAAIVEDITSARVRWVASTAMRIEFDGVLSRPHVARWRPDLSAARSAWQRWAVCFDEVPAPSPPSEGALRCTDPDDQKFIDLALQLGAAALLSRDGALLSLARSAGMRGLRIMTGTQWASVRLALGDLAVR